MDGYGDWLVVVNRCLVNTTSPAHAVFRYRFLLISSAVAKSTQAICRVSSDTSSLVEGIQSVVEISQKLRPLQQPYPQHDIIRTSSSAMARALMSREHYAGVGRKKFLIPRLRRELFFSVIASSLSRLTSTPPLRAAAGG